MVFAQIKNGYIVNTITLNDLSILNLFQNDPTTNEPFDCVLQINFIYPQPGIGWFFDGIIFNPPEQAEQEEE